MQQRNWTVRKAEKILLAACGSLWFTSCMDDTTGPSVNTGSSSGDQPKSSITPQVSSSSAAIQPLYGVLYSSAPQPSSMAASSSSLQEVVAFYGIIFSSPGSSSVQATDPSSSSANNCGASSSAVAASSAADIAPPLGIAYPMYGIAVPPVQVSSSSAKCP